MALALVHPSPASAPRPDVLAAIAAVARTLEPIAPHERAGLLRDEAAFLLDRLAVRVARGLGALEVAMGEGLAALAAGDRVLRLGWSCVGDYAREILDLAPGNALALVRLARALRERPLLREAVRRGEVTRRKAETILPVARGADESAWVERARSRETVRALAAAVRARGAPVAEDERWERFTTPLEPGELTRVDAALDLAGVLVGPAAPRWQRLEVVCQEYLGAHPLAPTAHERDAELPPSLSEMGRDLEALKAGLEEEFGRWEFLGDLERFEAPVAPGGADDEALQAPERALDLRLRELAAMRARWDALVGHLGMLLQNTGLWRDMCFASIGHYAVERLGMSGRALEQRAALDRRLWSLPALQTAMEEGRVSYEKARLVAAHATESTLGALVARAEALTCVALRRELEAMVETQMCDANEVTWRLPARVAGLLHAAIQAAREVAGAWLPPGEALARVADHFVEAWEHERPRARTPGQRAIARDRGWCTVPGCSRPGVHAHHVVFRSRGGGDEPENLTSLCAAHHLHAVHGGWLRVHGEAPDRLVWTPVTP